MNKLTTIVFTRPIARDVILFRARGAGSSRFAVARAGRSFASGGSSRLGTSRLCVVEAVEAEATRLTQDAGEPPPRASDRSLTERPVMNDGPSGPAGERDPLAGARNPPIRISRANETRAS